MSPTTTELNLETISYAKKGPIAYVTLNRPKVLNALNKNVGGSQGRVRVLTG